MSKGTKTPLAPQRVGIFGRKRYSVETNACDYLDYNLDNIWNSIGGLWAVSALLILALIKFNSKEK